MYIHVLIEIYFLAEHICLLKGDEPISLPVVPDTHTLVHFNVMFAHLFNVLSKSQAMSLYEINPVKTLTIDALVNVFFQPSRQQTTKLCPLLVPEPSPMSMPSLSTPSRCFKPSLQTPKNFEMRPCFAKN